MTIPPRMRTAAKTLKAAASPARLAILLEINDRRRGTIPPDQQDLAAMIGLTQPCVSSHIRKLQAGMLLTAKPYTTTDLGRALCHAIDSIVAPAPKPKRKAKATP